jgi:hypothetical protein
MNETNTYSFPYAFRKSSRLMPDWRQMVRNVAPLIRGWFGIVSGVRVPSAFWRIIEMCSRSRTISNPKARNAQTIFAFGASTGNFT